jgi:predicted permease
MTLLIRLRFVLRNLFGGRRADRALDAELQSSIDLIAAEHEARGLSPEAARRAAKLELGGTAQVAEHVRGARLGHGLSTVLNDLRYGWRGLRRSPGFSLVAISTLALGLGASIATFSVVHSVLWRALPYPSADRLVVIEADVRGQNNLGPASAEARAIAERSRTLTSVSVLNGVDAFLDVDGQLHRVAAASVTDGVLPLLGAQPMALGRTLSAREDTGPQWVTAVVISHRLWQRELGGDPRVIGRHISTNNLDVQVVGVLPSELRVHLPASTHMAEEIDVWFPKALENSRVDHAYPALAALKPGTTLEQAQSELDAMAREFAGDMPKAYAAGSFRLWVRPLREAVTREVRPALLALSVAVAFVLVIAWINAANLLIARAQTRERELSVRRALGASRGRLVRQLLAECALLASIGAVVGLAIAHAAVRAFNVLLPDQLPRQTAISVDQTIVLATISLTIMTTLLLGILPALWSGESRATALRAGRGDAGAPRRSLQRGLLIAEVALTVVSLVAAGLMLRTFVKLNRAPIGFDTTDILVAHVPLSGRLFETTEEQYALYKQAVEQVRALPGVTAVSAAGPIPFGPIYRMPRYFNADDPADQGAIAVQQTLFPDYFKIMGIRLIAGREFTDADVAEKRRVAIVDERIANALWQGQAVGRRIRLGRNTSAPSEVIGVTKAVRMRRVRDDQMPVVFLPFSSFGTELSLVVETTVPADVIAPSVRQTVEALGTKRAVYGIEPLADMAARSMDDTRLATSVLGVFAAATLLLAAIGLYGTLAYLISRRTREFGVRVALGATPQDLMRLVTREGLVLAAIGAAIGLAGTAVVGRLLRELLYEVSPVDPVTTAGVTIVVAITALLAVSHPAWRAARTDPNVALRAE